jgi:hypothetical protein
MVAERNFDCEYYVCESYACRCLDGFHEDPDSLQSCLEGVPEVEIIPEDGPGGWGTTSDVTADSIPTEQPILTDEGQATILNGTDAADATAVVAEVPVTAAVEEASAAMEKAVEPFILTSSEKAAVSSAAVALLAVAALVHKARRMPSAAADVLQTTEATPAAMTASL